MGSGMPVRICGCRMGGPLSVLRTGTGLAHRQYCSEPHHRHSPRFGQSGVDSAAQVARHMHPTAQSTLACEEGKAPGGVRWFLPERSHRTLPDEIGFSMQPGFRPVSATPVCSSSLSIFASTCSQPWATTADRTRQLAPRCIVAALPKPQGTASPWSRADQRTAARRMRSGAACCSEPACSARHVVASRRARRGML